MHNLNLQTYYFINADYIYIEKNKISPKIEKSTKQLVIYVTADECEICIISF